MDKASVARFVGLIIGELAYFGINVPQNFQELITGVIVGVFIIYVAFKNNYLTKKGSKQKEVLKNRGLTK